MLPSQLSPLCKVLREQEMSLERQGDRAAGAVLWAVHRTTPEPAIHPVIAVSLELDKVVAL